YTGANRKLVRDARWIAAAGAVLSPALLVSDLGRPERFLNMMRVFKLRSPMSVGGMDSAWILRRRCSYCIRRFHAATLRSFIAVVRAGKCRTGRFTRLWTSVFELHRSSDWRYGHPGLERECR